MQITVRLIHETDRALLQRLDWLYAQGERLNSALDTILSNQEKTMASLDDILADVAAESSQIDSIGVLIAQLREQVAGVTAGTLPPDVQAKVDAIFVAAESNKKKIADAVNANGAPKQDALPPANPVVPASTSPAVPPTTAFGDAPSGT